MKTLLAFLLCSAPIFAQSSGAGPIASLANNSLGVPCSVKAYGATGTGPGHDDTAAINAALAACYEVYFPDGPSSSYYISSPLMMRSGNYLHGGSSAATQGGAYIRVSAVGHGLSASYTTEGQYTSGGSITGTVTQTCNLTFLGGGGGTAVVALTGTNTVAAGTALSGFSGGAYNPAPTTATLSSGTATCSGTATVFITAPGAGTRNIRIENLYIEDDYGGRSATNGDGIYIDGGTDAAIVTINHVHTYAFGNSITLKSTISSSISNSRMDVPLANGFNQSGNSTSLTLLADYVDAPGQDCYSVSNLFYSTFESSACDSATRDGYHFDSAVAPNNITLNAPGVESAGRYGYLIEGQSNTLNSPSCIVTDVVGHRCFYLDDVAQIVINGPTSRNGDYGIYYNGGSLATTFAGQPIVTILGSGNWTPGSVAVAAVYDTGHVISYPDTPNGRLRGISFTMGDVTNTSALTTANVTYVTVPFACTISAWSLAIDAGTITVDFWKVATGTAIPTVTNTITASALPAIASGTALHSTTLTGWTTSVAANDIFAMAVHTVATAKFVNGVLECDQ